ncbi:MAG: hypothetical protein K2P09_01625 [Erysipelotrichales bacterium]|nr:hypothetical protein [Erysipelotrichales bacterium]
MPKYKIFGSEFTASRGNEYETKSLLYLVSLHKQKKEMYYYLVDVFNDVSGMSIDGKYIVDVQSKGHKNMSPFQLGERLVTLFKNYISNFNFEDYILVVSTMLSNKHLKMGIDLNKKEYNLISTINDDALVLCKNGLKEKVASYSIIKEWIDITNEDIVDSYIDEFVRKVHIYVADKNKEDYVESILGIDNYNDKDLLLDIFDEIAKHQIFKKSKNSIEGKEVMTPIDTLRFKRHLTNDQIQLLIVKRIIDNEYIANKYAAPRDFIFYLSCHEPKSYHDEIIDKCKDQIAVSLFNRNNRDIFWQGFMNIYFQVYELYDENRTLDEYYNLLNIEDFEKVLFKNDDYYTKLYILAMIIEGVKNDKD